MSGSDQHAQLAALQNSLKDDKPPANLSGPLEAHWHAGKGNFARALQLIEKDTSQDAAWVRAHLHRRKGESDQAATWYDKAGRNPSLSPVDMEWSEVAAGLLLHE